MKKPVHVIKALTAEEVATCIVRDVANLIKAKREAGPSA